MFQRVKKNSFLYEIKEAIKSKEDKKYSIGSPLDTEENFIERVILAHAYFVSEKAKDKIKIGDIVFNSSKTKAITSLSYVTAPLSGEFYDITLKKVGNRWIITGIWLVAVS